MDADILEGLPSLEESVAEAASADSASLSQPEPISNATPAAPVDAASVEPEPQVIEATVDSAAAEASLADAAPVDLSTFKSSETIPESVSGEVAPPADVVAKEKVDAGKVPDEKVASASGSGGFQIPEGPRVDVSAATVARMMGIASTNDLRVLEGRIDLLTSKVAAILTKMDRCLSMFSSIPTASDIGRLEVQLAAVKSMMKELLDSVGAPVGGAKEQADKQAAAEQSRKLREGIKTNTDS